MKMDITSKGWTVSHLLTTAGMVAGLFVWVLGYAENLTAVETKQEAIQASQRAEATRNKEWRESVRDRQGEFHKSLESIQQMQMDILKEIKR